ncbi:MAG: ergothioneine biosynthesis protein EgtB [Cyclobacteriaceae bacterium]|nr:ergothioneine biosynthesis protein EgtB [Cyclobacteriaceae bacterium]
MTNFWEKYVEIRSYSETLCKPLNTEDYIPQPEEFVSPPKWHLAHTTWFFEEFLLRSKLPEYKLFHPKFSFLFNSYYNFVGERTVRINRGNMTRPTVKEVYEYRTYVDQQIKILLQDHSTPEIENVLELGLNHEQQHQELLITDLKYTLSLNPLFPVYKSSFSLVNNLNSNSGFTLIKGGIHTIGHSGTSFCYDNELSPHEVLIRDFEISNRLITNGEYVEFINDGGYSTFNLWLDEGWAWVNANKIKHPLYWHNIEGQWHQYTLSGLLMLNPDEILAHVSYYEAAAFALWKEMRLPTEFEWEASSGQLDWGTRWEFTSSPYIPYPGFKIAKGAIGEYNGKFMINQMVLRGGSTATSKNHSRNTYRNFFHPHLQWQCTGIRLVK